MTRSPAPELLGRLDARDFDADEKVTLELEDGSTAKFHSAFYRREGDWTVIYTEHCGYHSFLAASIERIGGRQRA